MKSGFAVDNKKKKVSKKESHSLYIYKVLKKVHPDTGITTKAITRDQPSGTTKMKRNSGTGTECANTPVLYVFVL